MRKMNLLMSMISLVGITTSCHQGTVEQQYETTIAKRRSLVSTVLATGVIKPKVGAEVRVGSRVSGIVRKLNVNVGDVVRQGDLLASINDTEYTAQYNQVAANLDNAQTALKYATIEKDRHTALLAKHVIAQQSYDLAAKDYEIARAQVAQVTANLEYARIQLNNTRIIAPISGVVASVSTQQGETVAATLAAPTFLTIIDLRRLEVRAYVDETDISKVDEGQKAEFTVDTYPGITFDGVVKAIYPKAELIDNVVNYVVIIDLADIKGKTLRPEMTTTVTVLSGSTENVVAVPNKAITHNDGNDFVTILKDGRAEERKVTLGVKSKAYTQIVDGVAENETIILTE